MVINAEIPRDNEFFIHRVGRTGRNGMAGTAVTLYEPGQEDQIAELEHMGIKFAPKMIKTVSLSTLMTAIVEFIANRSKKTPVLPFAVW